MTFYTLEYVKKLNQKGNDFVWKQFQCHLHAPENCVQNEYVKLYDLDNASATNTQGNSTVSFFGVEVCAECKLYSTFL